MTTVKLSGQIAAAATRIAEECMGCEPSFCKARCPMHTDSKAYINLIANGKYDEAIHVIREKLFMPNVLGHICAHPCEMECRRNKEFKEPISIAALKRFAAERADDESKWDISVCADSGKRVAIIGSGPAGAQAAIDLRKAGHAVTIYEKNAKSGGVLRYGIPAYRLPKNILDHEYTFLDKLNVQFKFNIQVGRDISLAKLCNDYDAVLIATGAQRGSIIRMPGSDSPDVFSALDFLKEVSETGAFSKAKRRVMVIGGGDVAMDCIRTALRLPQVEEVHQCSLENEEILPASLDEKTEALEEGMQANFGFGPIEILTEGTTITGIRLKKVNSIFDETGKFNPQYGAEERDLAVDTVIMATGQTVMDITDGAIPQGGGGRYQIDRDTLATNLPNVFVAGDAAGGRIVVEAMALGRKASHSINRFLNGKDLKENRDFISEWTFETKLDVPLPKGTEDIPRIHKNLRPVAERIRDFKEVDLGFSDEEAQKEASRCLQCECRLCIKECVMMARADCCPKEAALPMVSSGQVDETLAYSCNDCDSCASVCPKDLPIRELYMGVRKDIVDACGGQPPLSEHYAVRVHQELGFSSLYTVRTPGGDKNA